METINIQYYKNNYTEFILGSCDNKLCLLDFRYRKMRKIVDNRLKTGLNAQFVVKDDEILQETRKQLQEYFAMQRKEFEIPLLTVGSAFQKSVWDGLIKIPYGTVNSYAQLARTINNEKAVRAVANANGANAIAIIIPCHRIIGSNGELTGFGGGIPLKKKLLELEQNLFTI